MFHIKKLNKNCNVIKLWKQTNKFRIISQQWLSENFHFEYSLREKYSREQFLTNFSLGNYVRTLWTSSQQTLKLEWKLDSQRKDANSILFSSFAKNTLGNNSRMYSRYRNDTSSIERVDESVGWRNDGIDRRPCLQPAHGNKVAQRELNRERERGQRLRNHVVLSSARPQYEWTNERTYVLYDTENVGGGGA